MPTEADNHQPSTDFIRKIVAEDMATEKWSGRVVTRFPPEPNGYAHIGHAMSLCLNFGVAQENGGRCHLRFDDTDPTKEEARYVEAIKEDVRWMGFDWGEHLYFASDYFEKLYEYAVQLVREQNAYVCDLSPEQIREFRGTLTEPGHDSPFRERSVEENLDLLDRMKLGKFEPGSRVLRAKIDMAHPNVLMRDPVIYRILKVAHYRRGTDWCIFPTYDWTHGQSDSIEGVTHSFCDTTFENHRPLYDWFLDALKIYHPQQIEFARMNITYTVMGKRLLRPMVEENIVSGWDDPRIPTLRGLRRRGFTPEAIREFCYRTGVSKFEGVADVRLLEHCLREDLNKRSPRVMAVLRPLRLVIENYPEGETEELEAINNPEDSSSGTRPVPFARVLYIEQEDFREEPPPKYFRLAPGREVRLRYAYFVRCVGVVKDEQSGEITEIRCVYDPATRGGDAPDGRRVKATLHWVSADHSLPAEVRLYDHLFAKEEPLDVAKGEDWRSNLNPNSLEVLTDCRVEPSLAGAEPGERKQFERLGYFCVDADSSQDSLVFNRTVTLRDAWAKIQKSQTERKKLVQ
jgi:glutaminyl-tRNA synthetase